MGGSQGRRWCRRRRRAPKVHQDRTRAVESIARSAQLGSVRLICAETPGQRGSVDWLLECTFPSWWRGRAEPQPGPQVERPQQREDERPWRRRGAAHAWPAGEGGPGSAHPAHPSRRVVVTGSCVRAPGLIWVRGPTRVRRQDDRWGVPPSARPRSLLRPSTDQPWRQGTGGRWPRHICLPMGGHAPAISVRPPQARAAGAPRPGRGRRRRAPAWCGAPGGRACAPPPGSPGCRPGGP
jgi:hypothetical protein